MQGIVKLWRGNGIPPAVTRSFRAAVEIAVIGGLTALAANLQELVPPWAVALASFVLMQAVEAADHIDPEKRRGG